MDPYRITAEYYRSTLLYNIQNGFIYSRNKEIFEVAKTYRMWVLRIRNAPFWHTIAVKQLESVAIHFLYKPNGVYYNRTAKTLRWNYLI